MKTAYASRKPLTNILATQPLAARELARSRLRGEKGPASEKTVDHWLDEQGLRASPAKQITQLVAVLGPWLTSVPVAAVFDYFNKALGG